MLVFANERGQRLGRDVERLGPETVERRAVDGVVGDAPHTGSTFGAGLGQQQRRTLVEHESRLTVARLGRLLLVDQQAAALHEVDDERDGLELQQQVLAAPTDRLERQSVGSIGPRHGSLQRSERHRNELVQLATRELRGQAFGVRLDLWKLGHRRLSGTRSADEWRRTRCRARRRPAAIRSTSAGCR